MEAVEDFKDMIEAFAEILKRVTIFTVMGKIILNLGMGKGYEKYTKIIIGFMVIVQLWAGINGILNIIKKEKIGEYERGFFDSWVKEMEEFENELQMQQKEIEKNWINYGNEEKKEIREKEENQEEKIQIEQIIIGKAKMYERTSFGESKSSLFAKG